MAIKTRRESLTARQFSAHCLHFLNHEAGFFLSRLELSFHIGQLCLQFHILIMSDHEGRVADDGAQEFFLGYLLEIGES